MALLAEAAIFQNMPVTLLRGLLAALMVFTLPAAAVAALAVVYITAQEAVKADVAIAVCETIQLKARAAAELVGMRGTVEMAG